MQCIFKAKTFSPCRGDPSSRVGFSDVAVQIQGAKEQFFQTVLLSLGARGQQPDRCFFLVAAAVAAQLARESAAALPKSFPTMSCVLLC